MSTAPTSPPPAYPPPAAPGSPVPPRVRDRRIALPWVATVAAVALLFGAGIGAVIGYVGHGDGSSQQGPGGGFPGTGPGSNNQMPGNQMPGNGNGQQLQPPGGQGPSTS